MTTAVQNLETAAYFPPPAIPSTSNANPKGSGAATSSSEHSDFQSELQQQDTGKDAGSNAATENKAAGRSEKGSGKPGKKPGASTEASNPVATPVQTADPQKQILPLTLTPTLPEESTEPGQDHKDSEQKDGQELKSSGVVLSGPKPPVGDGLSAAPDSSKDPGLPLAVNVAVSEDQATKPAQPESSSASQPGSAATLSPGAMRLAEATPVEPVAADPKEAIQEIIDSGSSTPSALAFAARMAASPQKADTSIPGDSAQPSAASAPTPDRIPVRYAATAQILQTAAINTKQGDGLKKDAGAAFEPSARVESQANMMLPRFETAREPAPNSAPAAPQQAAPSARTERVIETPLAAPTSSRDIRVQVPDNNGGSTQVRFVESGGEVRVSVRTADPALAQNLRSHLNDLSQRLADGGMPAEIWKPSANSASSQNDPNSTGRDGRGSGGQEPGGQGGQQDRQEQRPAWIEEMEASLGGEKH